MALNSVSRKLKNLLGRIAGRGSGREAQELLRAVVREMESKRQRLLEATYVPDRYRLYLNPADLRALGPLAGELEKELETQVGKEASERGYEIAGPVFLQLVEDSETPAGDLKVDATFVGKPQTEDATSEEVVAEPPASEDRTTRPAAETVRETRLVEPERSTRLKEPGWILEIVTGPESGRTIPVGAEPMTFGRGRDADVTLQDPEEFLSRVHARLAVREGSLQVEDLDSANGTELNGRRVETESVDSPAELLLGSLKLVCRPE